MKEYIALIYGEDGLIFRCDKPYKTRREAVMWFASNGHRGQVCTFVLYDGFVYDWVSFGQEVTNWLITTHKLEINSAIITTEAVIRNVKTMLVMQQSV